MGFRRQARELAMKMLFQIDVGSLSPRDVLHHFLEEVKAGPEVTEHAKALTLGVVKEVELLDELLSHKAKNWKLARMAGVDRNVLRIAAYELLRCPDVPREVVINEAIEIVKKYSTEESGAFVNGILDKLQVPHEPSGEKP
ncbi:MAG: transcription antitermination factor NusB [Candidatus Firestonebacteria bacterium]|nr:transcription antitermination factor NusB [Candidatus Firestonebacteria bacterium]